MPPKQMQMFGGDWTEQKLEMLRQYLRAYTKVLKNQTFELRYIDAFAGTGYRHQDTADSPLFPELAAQENQAFYDGSARIALETRPEFDRYILIERSEKRFRELSALKEEYSMQSDRIELVKEDCNAYLQRTCVQCDWRRRRAVLFLDPWGMQVDWTTIEAIAHTKAIDTWILFPLGVAVNRMLRRDGEIPVSLRSRLDRLFGTADWYNAFYEEQVATNLFGPERRTRKLGTFNSISKYYNDRLKAVFAEVAENPRRLYNSTGNPLFLFCFAAANPKGAPIAIRIAQHILKG